MRRHHYTGLFLDGSWNGGVSGRQPTAVATRKRDSTARPKPRLFPLAATVFALALPGCQQDATSPEPLIDAPLFQAIPCANGDFCTQTQGGWGIPPMAGNAGEFLHDNFAGVFPSGIIVGDPDGPDADGLFAIRLTSGQAVTDYLPSGGTPAALAADQTDPLMTSSGVFGGQLVAATISVAFDAAGLRRDGSPQPFPAGTLGTLVYVDGCVDDDLVGLSVNDVIALANTAINGGGTPAGVTIADLSDALVVLNENFVDCDTDLGCLAFRPIEALQNIINDVQDLIDGGVLTNNKANGLINKLNRVRAKVDKGQVQAAIDQLGSFMDQVSDFIAAGKLTAAEGQQLIDAAQAIIDALSV